MQEVEGRVCCSSTLYAGSGAIRPKIPSSLISRVWGAGPQSLLQASMPRRCTGCPLPCHRPDMMLRPAKPTYKMDAEATPEADSGRPGYDRAAAQGRLGRASNRAGAWPVAQRDQHGDRARPRHGRPLRRQAGTGRGGSAVGDVGQSWQPAVCRGGEAAAAAAGADRGAAQAPGGWNGSVVRTTSEAIYQAIYAVPRGELRRQLLACLRQGKPQRGPRTANGGAGSATAFGNGRRRWRNAWCPDIGRAI